MNITTLISPSSSALNENTFYTILIRPFPKPECSYSAIIGFSQIPILPNNFVAITFICEMTFLDYVSNTNPKDLDIRKLSKIYKILIITLIVLVCTPTSMNPSGICPNYYEPIRDLPQNKFFHSK